MTGKFLQLVMHQGLCALLINHRYCSRVCSKKPSFKIEQFCGSYKWIKGLEVLIWIAHHNL